MSVCVFGDAMLDTYVQCTPVRVSPEAPVLICRHGGETYAPGGAANVAANIKSGNPELDVELVGVVGGDNAAHQLTACLESFSINHKRMVQANYWKTIEKRRFVDELGRQLLRLDIEGDLNKHAKLAQATESRLQASLINCGADRLVISDYGKGTCTSQLTRFALKHFRDKYTIVNGKPDRLLDYQDAHLLVYNLAEAEAAWNKFGDVVPWSSPDIASLAGYLYRLMRFAIEPHQPYGPDILITCGAQGMVLWKQDGPHWQEAYPVAVADVTGAGDTVVATIAAHGRCDGDIMKLAAQNAAAVVSKRGTSVWGQP